MYFLKHKQIKLLSKFHTLVGTYLVAILCSMLFLLHGGFALAQSSEPQSQADCPAGTVFIKGYTANSIKNDLNSITGGGSSSTPTSTPNKCSETKNLSDLTKPSPDSVTVTCPDGGTVSVRKTASPDDVKLVCAARAAGIVPGAEARPLPADCKPDASGELNANNCRIIQKLVTFIRILSGLVGIVVVLMIAYSGIQYSMARDNAQAVTAAKERIRNAIIALVVYLFLFAFLQWLVPGGVVSV